MRLSQAWIIARHDISLIRVRRGVLVGLFAYPLGVGIGFPVLISLILSEGGADPASWLPQFIDAFAFWFVIGAVSIPTAIAAYSIVGEKIEKSLEPLLATPTTDSEILMGKALAAFVPTMLAIWSGATIFMALADWAVRGALGGLYYPNWTMGVILLLAAPLACLFSIEVSIAVSARTTDVRSAQQYGGLVFLPLIILYVGSEIGSFVLNTPHLLIVAAGLAVLDLLLFIVSRATFHRDEILTRWK